jgi:ABC-type Fe3+-hydroxamate transport system substrate-binding protein
MFGLRKQGVFGCGMRIVYQLARSIYLSSLLLVLGFAGCGGNEITTKGPVFRIVQDDLGRSVKLPGKVDRVVSLAPSLTESIFAVGAGDKLVGVTTYCNYPEAANGKEKIGDTQTPNIERIVALKPDAVFVSTASQLEAFMRTLEQQNIAVYVMDAKSIAEVIDDLRTLGRLLGTEEAADGLAQNLEERVERIESTSGPEAGQRVFIQISNEPLFTIGKDSFLTELVFKAGGTSVTADVPSAYPKLSKETASAMNPNVIILSDSEDNREPNLALKNSTAVKTGRVFRINADIISRPGPRLVDALDQIFDLIRKY